MAATMDTMVQNVTKVIFWWNTNAPYANKVKIGFFRIQVTRSFTYVELERISLVKYICMHNKHVVIIYANQK